MNKDVFTVRSQKINERQVLGESLLLQLMVLLQLVEPGVPAGHHIVFIQVILFEGDNLGQAQSGHRHGLLVLLFGLLVNLELRTINAAVLPLLERDLRL